MMNQRMIQTIVVSEETVKNVPRSGSKITEIADISARCVNLFASSYGVDMDSAGPDRRSRRRHSAKPYERPLPQRQVCADIRENDNSVSPDLTSRH